MENIDKYNIYDIIIMKYIDWRYNMAKVKARNRVIEGDYEGKAVGIASLEFYILLGIFKSIYLNNDNVESYQVVGEQIKEDTYAVLINFKDGKKSLIEMDGKHFSVLKKNLMYNVKL